MAAVRYPNFDPHHLDDGRRGSHFQDVLARKSEICDTHTLAKISAVVSGEYTIGVCSIILIFPLAYPTFDLIAIAARILVRVVLYNPRNLPLFIIIISEALRSFVIGQFSALRSREVSRKGLLEKVVE